MKEALTQQLSSNGIEYVDRDDQERVLVQPGGVVIVKSSHGCLWERIKGGAIFDLNYFALQQATFASKNKVTSLYY